jgi:5'-methylthioadenosine phosphorylase
MTEIGIIGGTGIYDPKIMKNPEEIKIHTPYGSPSDVITVGKILEKKLPFFQGTEASILLTQVK